MNCTYHGDKEAIAGCISCGSLICETCSVEIDGKKYCKECISKGKVSASVSTTNEQPAKKSKTVAALLAFFVGGFGVHRFYLGYNDWKAITQLILGIAGIVTCGVTTIIAEIWALVDFILVLTGNLTTPDGKPLS